MPTIEPVVLSAHAASFEAWPLPSEEEAKGSLLQALTNRVVGGERQRVAVVATRVGEDPGPPLDRVLPPHQLLRLAVHPGPQTLVRPEQPEARQVAARSVGGEAAEQVAR